MRCLSTLAGIIMISTLTIALFATPMRPSITQDTTGNPQLAARLQALIQEEQGEYGKYSVAAAIITPKDLTYAAIGKASPNHTPIGPDSPFEAGSITKTFNGQLLAYAIDQGEVTATDTLDKHLPKLSGTPIGKVTLEEAVSHRGGIPPLPNSAQWHIPAYVFQNENPYAHASVEELLAEVRDLSLLPERGQVTYSNLGATLLGHALASAAGYNDWGELVNERLFIPLKMNTTIAAATDADIPAAAVPGYSANGRVAAYWPSPAYRPAGASTFTTIEDMGRYAQGLMAGTAPGMAATKPRWDAGDDGLFVGYAWFNTRYDDVTVTWHNGGTGGFSTFLALDLDAQRAVMIVGNTTESVDEIGLALLTDEPPLKTTHSYFELFFLLVTLLALGGLAWNIACRKSWLTVVGSAANAAAALALARVLGPWSFLPGWVWTLLVAAMVSLLIWALPRRLPAQPERWRKLNTVHTIAAITLALVFAALLR